MLLLSSADFYFKIYFFSFFFRNTIEVSNIIDPDLGRRFVGPNLGSICLQMLSTDDISRLACKELKQRRRKGPNFSQLNQRKMLFTQEFEAFYIEPLFEHRSIAHFLL